MLRGQHLPTECPQQEVNFCPTYSVLVIENKVIPVHHYSAWNILYLFWLSNKLASLNLLNFKHIFYGIPSELAIQVVRKSLNFLDKALVLEALWKRESKLFLHYILEREMNHQRILNLLSNLKCTSQLAQHNEYCIRKHVNSFFLNEL